MVLRKEPGDKSGIAWLLNMMGEVARFECNAVRAQGFYDESLDRVRRVATGVASPQ